MGEDRLTKTALWKAADITSSSVSHWFNGTNGADLECCFKIAPILKVNPFWLFDGRGKIDDPLPIPPGSYIDSEKANLFAGLQAAQAASAPDGDDADARLQDQQHSDMKAKLEAKIHTDPATKYLLEDLIRLMNLPASMSTDEVKERIRAVLNALAYQSGVARTPESLLRGLNRNPVSDERVAQFLPPAPTDAATAAEQTGLDSEPKKEG